MWNAQTILAVIPARGGSKGIPRKNLREVAGRSLICWSAETVRSLPWLDAAVLSTDDDAIAAEGRRCGLAVPFQRPAEFSTDQADSVGMWRHAWLESERAFNTRFDCSILLQPTTPLRRAEDITRTIQTLFDQNVGSALTVSPVPHHFSPAKCLVLSETGRISPANAREPLVSNRHGLARTYWRNGACYAVRRGPLIDQGLILTPDAVGVVIDEFMVNIDDPIELELADFLARRSTAAPPCEHP